MSWGLKLLFQGNEIMIDLKIFYIEVNENIDFFIYIVYSIHEPIQVHSANYTKLFGHSSMVLSAFESYE